MSNSRLDSSRIWARVGGVVVCSDFQVTGPNFYQISRRIAPRKKRIYVPQRMATKRVSSCSHHRNCAHFSFPAQGESKTTTTTTTTTSCRLYGSMGTGSTRACCTIRRIESCMRTNCTRRHCTCLRRSSSSTIGRTSQIVSGSASAWRTSRRSARPSRNTPGATGETSPLPR